MFIALWVLSPFILGAAIYGLASGTDRVVSAFASRRAAGADCKGCTDTSCPGYNPWV